MRFVLFGSPCAQDINVVVLSPYSGELGDLMTTAEPLLEMALQEIENSTLLPGYRLNVTSAKKRSGPVWTCVSLFWSSAAPHGATLANSCASRAAQVVLADSKCTREDFHGRCPFDAA